MANRASSKARNEIRLRDVIGADIPVFFEHQLDPVATEMAAFPARDKATFNAHWSRILADDSLIKQTVLVNGEVAGNLVCFTRFDEREVGYWLGRAYWGKGVATTALAAFLHGILTRPLHARVAKHNIGSQRVLEKCGFSVAGEEAFMENGREIVELVYILTSDSCGKHS